LVALADRAATKLAQGQALTEASARAVDSAIGCDQHEALWAVSSEQAAKSASRDELAVRAALIARALDIATRRSGPGLDFDCRLDRAYLHVIAELMYLRAGVLAEAKTAVEAAVAEYAGFQPFTPRGKGGAPKVLQAELLAMLRQPRGDALYQELAGATRQLHV
jgi:hypothetical protein